VTLSVATATCPVAATSCPLVAIADSDRTDGRLPPTPGDCGRGDGIFGVVIGSPPRTLFVD
jgi:hypothetical protein